MNTDLDENTRNNRKKVRGQIPEPITGLIMKYTATNLALYC